MSTVPAALSALVTRLRYSPAIAALNAATPPGAPRVRVDDGPWLDRPDEPDVIVVGWTPEDGQAVALSTSYDMASAQESYDVVCLASSWSGDTDIAARRARVDALVDAVRAELRADPTLGGAVAHAEVTSQSWTQYQTSSGCEVPVEFVVHVDAFRLD